MELTSGLECNVKVLPMVLEEAIIDAHPPSFGKSSDAS